MSAKRIIFYWLPPLAYMAVIFYMSSRPVPKGLLPDIWNIDKVIHFIEFGILGILWFRALETVGVNSKQSIVAAFIMAFLYGISDEVHQSFVPERDASIYDAMADGLGGWIGIWVYKTGRLKGKYR